MERVMVTLPEALLDEIDITAKRLAKKRSAIVRQAVQEWLERERQREFEELMAEGYQALASEQSALVAELMPLEAVATVGIWRWDD